MHHRVDLEMSHVQVVDLRWRRGCCGGLAVSRFQLSGSYFEVHAGGSARNSPTYILPTYREAEQHSTYNIDFLEDFYSATASHRVGNTHWIPDVPVRFGEHYTPLARTSSCLEHEQVLHSACLCGGCGLGTHPSRSMPAYRTAPQSCTFPRNAGQLQSGWKARGEYQIVRRLWPREIQP